MKLSHSVIAISLALASGFALTSALANTNEQHRELSLPLAGISALDAKVGAGSFTLKASSEVDKLLVEAHINNGGDTEPELTLEKHGDTAVLVAKFPDGISWFGNSPYIDITVTVPENMQLALVDGSGDIHIEGLKGDIRVKDGSGSMEIIGGKAVSIDDGSGEIRVSNINGDTRIQDGSGDISATDIQGSIVINDGSGDIRVSKVSAMVEITDGSGDIDVSDAESLKLHATGSGSVTSNNIRSGVSL